MAFDALADVLQEIGGALRVVTDGEAETTIGFSRDQQGLVVETAVAGRDHGVDYWYQVKIARYAFHRRTGTPTRAIVYIDGRFHRTTLIHQHSEQWEATFPHNGRNVLIKGSGHAPSELVLATSWGPHLVN